MSNKLLTRIWDSEQYDKTTLLVLLALADQANDAGLCWPSVARIAKRARCSPRHVQRVIAALESDGAVKVHYRAGTSSYYTINAARFGEGSPEEGRQDVGGDNLSVVTPRSGEGRHPGHPRGDTQVTQTLNEPPMKRELHQTDEHEEDFAVFWSACPRKVGKGQARRAYKTARAKASAPDLLVAMQRFAEATVNADPKFVAHPATWLNGERWLDEAPAESGPLEVDGNTWHDWLMVDPMNYHGWQERWRERFGDRR